jgi:hypothetical protein
MLEGNIYIKHIWRNQEHPLALYSPEIVSPLKGEALSSPETMSILGREVLRIGAACSCSKSTHMDTNPFYVENLSLERKNHGPKPPKSSSTIIK